MPSKRGGSGIASSPAAAGEPAVAGRSAAAAGGSAAGADPDPEAVARLICLRLLTAEPRTRAQLADALKRRRVPAEAAEAVLSRFTEVGLIDDATFASAWVESRHHGRGLGRRALATELGRRGVAHEDIAAAVEQLTPEAERAMALALVERRIASLARQPRPVQVRKLAGMLARKGYPPGLAYSVVRQALDQAGVSGAADEEFAVDYEALEESAGNDDLAQAD